MVKRPFGDRVLRVRLRAEADNGIALAAHAAVRALVARGIRAILDEIPLGCQWDEVPLEWTNGSEVKDSLTLFAGGDLDDPIADRMAEAWSYAFGGAHEFIAMYEDATERLIARDLDN